MKSGTPNYVKRKLPRRIVRPTPSKIGYSFIVRHSTLAHTRTQTDNKNRCIETTRNKLGNAGGVRWNHTHFNGKMIEVEEEERKNGKLMRGNEFWIECRLAREASYLTNNTQANIDTHTYTTQHTNRSIRKYLARDMHAVSIVGWPQKRKMKICTPRDDSEDCGAPRRCRNVSNSCDCEQEEHRRTLTMNSSLPNRELAEWQTKKGTFIRSTTCEYELK